jgi:hypothetical protein
MQGVRRNWPEKPVMSKVPKQVSEFLSKRHIAVAGVSRDFQQPANAIYRKLKGAGYQVYAINPNAERVEGDACYPDLHSTPEPVEAVMVVTHPDIAAKVVRECADLGIRHVWLHRSLYEVDSQNGKPPSRVKPELL